ncbi:NAD(P)-dependent oxidoreductase [Lentibacillus sp. L22]|uniref:NAD(P)-dependent oxidoreductase n=1 Tax=Lentibacillus sp. L22 TaxID=3163028 RepID=UPI0034655C03
MKKVGFIGVGVMGHWMVNRLIEHGKDLIIYDSNRNALQPFEKSNANIANSITEVGEVSDIVILMLPDSSIVNEVITNDNGLIHSMEKNTIIIDMSSSYAFETQKMKAFLNKSNIRMVDAPVSGGVNGAKNGTLTIMVGGDKDDYREIESLLNCMGSQIKLIGDNGAGHALKAINNYLSATSMYATAEAMILAEKLGVDPEIAIETINQCTGQSFSTHVKYPNYVLSRKFESNFSMHLLLKDIKMAKAMASDSQMPMLLGSTVVEIYEAAYLMGRDEQDHTEIIKFLEQLTNEKLGTKGNFSNV